MMRILLLGLALLAAAADVSAQYSPTSFGAVVGANQADSVRAANFTAMKACVESAMASKGTVSLPSGTIEIDVPNLGSSAASTLKIKRDLQIIGADRHLSKLKFGPESPAYGYSGFYVGPNTMVSFKNLTIEGPRDPGPEGKFNRLTYAILQSGMSYSSPGRATYDTPGELRLENVTIAGEWYTSIQGAHGDVPLVLLDCDITGYTQCVTWSASFNLGKRLYAKNTFFHDAGLPGKGHLIYLSPSVSFEIVNCRFAGNYRYAIHHYGSSKLTARFARLINSKFEASCADGIETTNTGLTEIINCVFDNKRRGVSLKGNATIQGSTFNCQTGVTTYDNHSGLTINISRCKFRSPAVAVITSVWPACEWKISDCDFVGTGPNSVGIANGAPNTRVYIANCSFAGVWKRGIRASAGSYRVNGCVFTGSYVEAAVIFDAAADSAGELGVFKCTFKNSGRSIWAANGASGKVVGEDNFFESRQPEAMNERKDDPLKPSSATMYQRLQLRKGQSPLRLASADVLMPSFNYDTYQITGAATINSIKLGGRDDVTRMCVGSIHLQALGQWLLGDSGNIKPLAPAPRRVGEIVTLVYDPQTGFWVELKQEPSQSR
jgi:hypothetical protein